VFLLLPCAFGFAFGWALWDRWLAQTGTLLVWALFLFPFAAAGAMGPQWELLAFALTGASFVTSLVLTEIGVRVRDAFERWRRARR
jgi:hypothetical protein